MHGEFREAGSASVKFASTATAKSKPAPLKPKGAAPLLGRAIIYAGLIESAHSDQKMQACTAPSEGIGDRRPLATAGKPFAKNRKG